MKRSVKGQLYLPETKDALEAFFKSFIEKASDILDDYLAKGKRIEDMAREAFQKEMKGLTFSEYEKKLFSVELGDHDFADYHAEELKKRVINPLLRATEDFSEEGEVMKFLRSFIDFDFRLERATEVDRNSMSYRSLRYKWRKSADILIFTASDGNEDFKIFGYRGYDIPKNMQGRVWRTPGPQTEMFGNVGDIISSYILMSLYNRVMADEDKRLAVKEALGDSFTREKRALSRLSDCLDRSSFGSRLNIPFYERKYKEIPFILSEDPPCKEAVSDFFEVLKLPSLLKKPSEVLSVGGSEDIPTSYIKQLNRNALEAHEKPLAYILTKDIEVLLIMLDPVKSFERGYGRLDAFKQFPVYDGKRLSKIAFGLRDCDIGKVIRLLFEQKKSAMASASYYHQMANESHAKSFESRKQTTKKALKAAADDALNERFGFIEFDESVDLSKASVVTGQIKAFADTYLPNLDLSSVSLRFRKLGNHKASGLYYPAFRCICVDIHSPSSFVHELGHCIDHVAGGGVMSEAGDFYSVYRAYCDAMGKVLYSKDKPKEGVMERLRGNSKYNLSYYQIKTEAFARCFEMYVVRTLGFDNSICRQDSEDDFAYPANEKLMEMVNTYFEKLLAGLGFVREEGASKEEVA